MTSESALKILFKGPLLWGSKLDIFPSLKWVKVKVKVFQEFTSAKNFSLKYPPLKGIQVPLSEGHGQSYPDIDVFGRIYPKQK